MLPESILPLPALRELFTGKQLVDAGAVVLNIQDAEEIKDMVRRWGGISIPVFDAAIARASSSVRNPSASTTRTRSSGVLTAISTGRQYGSVRSCASTFAGPVLRM